MPIVTNEVLTPREAVLLEAEKEEGRLVREHQLDLKRLDIEATKLETRWNIIFKIPLTIIKLPVYFLFGIAYIVSVGRKHELPDQFWNFMR